MHEVFWNAGVSVYDMDVFSFVPAFLRRIDVLAYILSWKQFIHFNIVLIMIFKITFEMIVYTVCTCDPSIVYL